MQSGNDVPSTPPPAITGESCLCSGRLITCKNVRDTNPPPPDESQSDVSQSLLTDDGGDFTILGRTHGGHHTTSPGNAAMSEVIPTTVPTANHFNPLAQQDDTSSIKSGNPTPAVDNMDQQQRIDDIFCEADAHLVAATNIFDAFLEQFTPHITRIKQALDRRLTTSIET
jgi:hypothetical protein